MGSKSDERDNEVQPFTIEKGYLTLVKEIEQARLDLHHEYEQKRMALLTQHKEQAEWLLGALADLRKERVAFQKKSIAEIAAALAEAKLPEALATDWLQKVNDLYHQDLTLAQQLVSVDVSEVDNDLFLELKKRAQAHLLSEMDHVLKTSHGRASGVAAGGKEE